VRSLVLVLLVVAAAIGRAEPWTEGTTIAPIAGEDQHGARAEIGPETRLLIVSRDMDGGGIVKEVLGTMDQTALDARGAVYVADISGMPAVVSRLMAIPNMRKRPYRVVLDREGSLVPDVPAVEGKPAVVTLDRLRVGRIAHPSTAGELHDLLAVREPAAP
jgi:hypothetical protein